MHLATLWMPLVLHEKEIELQTSSGKWLIKVSGSEIQAVNNTK